MTLIGSFLLGCQIDLYVCDVVAAAQEVMANQPVEVEWRGSSHVSFEIRNLRNPVQGERELPGDGHGLFQARSLRHIDYHLEFAFVIEGEHLNNYKAEVKEAR